MTIILILIKMLAVTMLTNITIIRITDDHRRYMVGVIQQSFLNFRTKAYDILQWHQNQIPY